MRLNQVAVPEIYTSSADFRTFLHWFQIALERIRYDTENLLDLYDPLKCPSHLLWMLADTMGFRYDDRLCTAFNRAVLVYFMSMIRNKGSKDGVALAAEVNLKQFLIEEDAQADSVLWERLEDTTIPVNAVSVTPHTAEGYIDVVYFSTKVPVDACIEYVRPLGMYLFDYAGVRLDGETKISVDARLTNLTDLGVSLGPTHVGHYRRDDYARMQRIDESEVSGVTVNRQLADRRHLAWYRNSQYEGDPSLDAGYRALYSLQLCNNEHVVQALIQDDEGRFVEPDRFFELGYQAWMDSPEYNLIYRPEVEATHGDDVSTIEQRIVSSGGDIQVIDGPGVNMRMSAIGDAISLDEINSQYTKRNPDGSISVVNVPTPVDDE